MSSTASPQPVGGPDAIVDADNALRLPASKLAGHGARAGNHSPIVTGTSRSPPRRSVRGTLADTAAPHDVEALLAALGDRALDGDGVGTSWRGDVT